MATTTNRNYPLIADNEGDKPQAVNDALEAIDADVTTAATASKIIARDANGRAKVADPLADDDIATKGYVTTHGGSGLNPLGAWNASTNSPALASGVGTKGDYYVVSNAGTTAIDGISDWGSGDWIIFNGTVWEKIDNSERYNKFAQDIGDGTATSFTVTHNLGTKDLSNVLIYENFSSYNIVQPSSISIDTTNQITVTFASAPSSGQYRVVVTA